jgi:hypothetical protein
MIPCQWIKTNVCSRIESIGSKCTKGREEERDFVKEEIEGMQGGWGGWTTKIHLWIKDQAR